jgi:hypothetical protein
LLTIFGGRLKDIESILVEERIPDGWESRILQPYGLTMAAFNRTVLPLEFSINEDKYRATLAAETSTAQVSANPDISA